MRSGRVARAAAPILGLAAALAACTPSTAPIGAATSSPSTVVSASPTPEPASPTTSTTPSPSGPKVGPPSPVEDPRALPIAITIFGGEVEPNGEKIEVTRGQRINLSVTSDIDDEIHAHDGGDGYALSVAAGQTASGSFIAAEPGSFEIESHELEKTIVILNVR